MLHLEHIGIAIPDLASTVRLFEDILARQVYKTEVVASEKVTTYFLDAGGAKIELLTTEDVTSVTGKFLERRGPGLHHLAFEVSDIDEAFRRASDSGLRLASSAVMDGADGKRVFFIHPRSASGVLIEFCQTSRAIFETSPIELGSHTFRFGRAGSPGNPPLLVLTQQHHERGVHELVRGFESSRHVTVLLSPGDSAVPGPAILHDAGFDTSFLACDVRTGFALLDESVPKRAAAFLEADHVLPTMWTSRRRVNGLICICPAATARRADILPVESCAFLPDVEVPFSPEGIRLALPLLRRHLDD